MPPSRTYALTVIAVAVLIAVVPSVGVWVLGALIVAIIAIDLVAALVRSFLR